MSRAPDMVRKAAGHILRILSIPSNKQVVQRYEQIPTIAATEAGADAFKATIGGWYALSPEYDKLNGRWFIMDITPQLHPWAYEGSPQGNIAAAYTAT